MNTETARAISKKVLIENLIEELNDALDYIETLDPYTMTPDEKERLYRKRALINLATQIMKEEGK